MYILPESYAPFCSMAVRESFLTVDQQLATAPGPAHYTPDLVEDHVKGGDSLKSKVTTFFHEKNCKEYEVSLVLNFLGL